MNNLINFLKTRRSTTAKTMISGHIKKSDLNDILACGIRVPDHGALNPWSLTVISDKARSRIGKEILVPEYILNYPKATKEEINFEKNRFLRASLVIAVLFKPVSHLKYHMGNGIIYWRCVHKYTRCCAVSRLCRSMAYRVVLLQ